MANKIGTLKNDIAEMEEVFNDSSTPAEVKKALEPAIKKAKEQLAELEKESEPKKAAAPAPKEAKKVEPKKKKSGYNLGDMYSEDFDYDGMLKMGLTTNSSWAKKDLQKLHDSFEDVNYHTAAAPLFNALYKSKDKKEIEDNLKKFHKSVKEELGEVEEVVVKKEEPKKKKTINDSLQKCKDLLAKYQDKKKNDAKRLQKRAEQGKPVELTPAETVKKSAQKVEAKVIDIVERRGGLKASEVNQLANGIIATIKSTLEGIEDTTKKQRFLKEIGKEINDLEKHLPKAAANGMYMEDGIEVDKNGLIWALQNFVSSGTIAAHTYANTYDEVDKVRHNALEILFRDGDKPYSLDNLVQLLKKAEKVDDRSFASVGRMNYADGGEIYDIRDYNDDLVGSYLSSEKLIEWSNQLAKENNDNVKITNVKEAIEYIEKPNGSEGQMFEVYTKFADGGSIDDKYMIYGTSDEGWFAVDKTTGKQVSPTSFGRSEWNSKKEVLADLNSKKFEDGGSIADSNKEMIMSNVHSIKHHADEIEEILSNNVQVEAWVSAKAERAATDLSDITHYLDGLVSKMALGGMVEHSLKNGDKVIEVYKDYGILEDSDMNIFVYDPNIGQRVMVSSLTEAKSTIDSMDTDFKKKAGLYADGGHLGHYNTGRSWHQDRARHNNSESWENKKKLFEDGGRITQLVGEVYRPFISHNEKYWVTVLYADFENIEYSDDKGEIHKAKTKDFLDSYIKVANQYEDGGRIEEMVEHWNRCGWAGSNINYHNDSEFFKKIGKTPMNVSTTSFTGNDIKYYDEDRVEVTAGGFKQKFESGGTTDCGCGKSKYEDGGEMMAKGGVAYNTGRSWHQDRERHNKGEDWEKPLSERKMEGGGVVKKGEKYIINLDGKNENEEVTVISDFKAGHSKTEFITLKRKVGANYYITLSRFEKSIVKKLESGGEMLSDRQYYEEVAKDYVNKYGVYDLREMFLKTAMVDERSGDKETAKIKREIVKEYMNGQPKFMAKGGGLQRLSGEEIYAKAEKMSESEYDELFSKSSNETKELANRLERLGDDKKVALITAIDSISWQKKNYDSSTWDLYRYAKGGEVDESLTEKYRNDLYIAIEEANGFWYLISPPMETREKAERYSGGQRQRVVTLDEVKKHNKVIGREDLIYAKGGNIKNKFRAYVTLNADEYGHTDGENLKPTKFYLSVQQGGTYLWKYENRLLDNYTIFKNDEDLKKAIDKVRRGYPTYELTANKFNKEFLPQSELFEYAKGGNIKQYKDLSTITPSFVNDNEFEKGGTIIKLKEVDLVKTGFVEISSKIQTVSSSQNAIDIFREFWNENNINIQESFNVLFLNRANKPIGIYNLSKGGILGTIADPELIAAMAIKTLAKGVIICHNHPSGNLNPSQADITVSKKIKEGLKLFDIELLDSMIITEKSYSSLAENGYLEKGGKIGHYNTGRSWHQDRAKHNKAESWEKPLGQRKMDSGGEMMAKGLEWEDNLYLTHPILNQFLDDSELYYGFTNNEMIEFIKKLNSLGYDCDVYSKNTDIIFNPNKKQKKGTTDLYVGFQPINIRLKKMAMGGEVKFSDKVKEVKASLLKTKKVSPKVQKDYGKTYSPKEAEQAAKRIVGSRTAKWNERISKNK